MQLVKQDGICPTGWHVPSDAEWIELVNYVVSQGYPNSWNDPNGAGNALKSCRQVDSPLVGECDTSDHPLWDLHSTHRGFDEFGIGEVVDDTADKGIIFIVCTVTIVVSALLWAFVKKPRDVFTENPVLTEEE